MRDERDELLELEVILIQVKTETKNNREIKLKQD